MAILDPLGQPMPGQNTPPEAPPGTNRSLSRDEMNEAITEVTVAMTGVSGVRFDVAFVNSYRSAREAMDLMARHGVPYTLIPAKIDQANQIWIVVYPRPFTPQLRTECGWVGDNEVPAAGDGREQPGGSPDQPGSPQHDPATVPWEKRGKDGPPANQQGPHPG